MARALGLDIGTHACKVAVVDGGGKSARLVRFVEVPYEVGGGGVPTKETILAGVRRALSESKGPRTAASHAFPAEQCILREISVPFEQDEQIRKTVKFEFEPHLHAGSIEDVVLDYLKTGSARTGTRLLVIAGMKDAIRERLALLQQAGVEALHLDVDVAAIFNVAKQSGALEEHPNCLLIDIGARTTKAVSVRDGQLRVARSIRLGARGAQREVERRMEGDAEAAKRAIDDATGMKALYELSGEKPSTVEIVNSVQEVEAAVARAAQDDFLSRVLRETQRSLPAAGADRPLTRVFLTGGGSRHPRARERIAAHFGVEVTDLPVLGAVTHELPPTEAANVTASGAVAVGTALKVLGIDHVGLDLRKDEFRYARTFDRVKVAIAAGVTILFFGVFLFWLTSLLRLQKLQREAEVVRSTMEKELKEEVFDAYAAAVPEPRKAPESTREPTVAFRRMREHSLAIRNHLKNELGLATEVPPIRSCLETWAATMRAVQSVRAKIDYILVKDEKYFQDRAEITVIVGELAQGDLVLNALQKEPIFESVDFRPNRRTKDGKYEIPIHMKVIEMSADEPAAKAPANPGGDGK